MADNFDKFYPDWVVGTLTLVSGSRNFTATNAQLTLAAIREGDTIITPGGLTLPIESINANGNGGVLAQSAPAAAAGTYATRIRFQSDNSRFTGMLAALVTRISGGNLQSIAGLAGAADKGIMFTGAGTAGTFDLPQRGRDLLAGVSTIGLLLGTAANTSVAKNAIGLGNVENTSDANKPVSSATQTSLNGKANLNGAIFTGPVTSNSYLHSRQPKGTGSPGDQLLGGSILSSYLADFGVAPFINLRLREVINNNVFALLHVAGYGGVNAYFNFNASGGLQVPGALSKGSGTFLIDHPKDPYNKNLRHGFVEAPEYLNIYRGVVDLENGKMSVDIDKAFGMSDGTFAALNVEICTFLQTQYGPDRVWLDGPADSGKFTIISENGQSNAAVAFMVTGRRNDAFVRSDLDPNTDSEGRFIPEFDKEDA